MAAASEEDEIEVDYHSRDFEWEELCDEVAADPSLAYHLDTVASSSDLQPAAASSNSDAWRRFHRQHSTGKFFKERRYLLKEFPDLLNCAMESKVLEVGCGNGSSVLPILRGNPSILVYGCDCSEDIVEKTKEFLSNITGGLQNNRFFLFSHDITLEGFPEWFLCKSCQSTLNTRTANLNSDSGHSEFAAETPSSQRDCCTGGVNFITLIFTLSAVPFNQMSSVIDRCVSVLKPGGLLLFRDYGIYDMTMLRFQPERRLDFCEYMRLDGTYSYYFSLDIVRSLFCSAGLTELELEYCCVKSVNRKNGKRMRRIWVHGKFQKPVD